LRERPADRGVPQRRKRFGVQVHVVDDGAVDVEDDGTRRKTQWHI
jgi:hypothetical protein